MLSTAMRAVGVLDFVVTQDTAFSYLNYIAFCLYVFEY